MEIKLVICYGAAMVPKVIQESLSAWFGYPDKMVHGQVSTTSEGRPHIRTMMLYGILPNGDLAFLSRTDTQKWRDLQDYPHVAVCFVEYDHGQLIAEGRVTLLTRDTAPNETRTYWQDLDRNFKNIYVYDYLRREESDSDVPDTFGVLILKPSRWEILNIRKDDYTKSSRKEFRVQGTDWETKALPPV